MNIKVEMIQGVVNLKNKIDLSVILLRNNMHIDTSKGKTFNYEFKTGKDSWAILKIEGKDVIIKPDSLLKLTNSPEISKHIYSKSSVRLVLGKLWAALGGPESDDSGAGGGGGIRG